MDGFDRLRELLPNVNKLFFDIIMEELAKAGITKPQIIVLEQIKESPKTIGEISKAVDLSYSTVSGIVDRLERDGWVIRKKDEKDRRVVWVTPVNNLERLEECFSFMRKGYIPEIFEGISQAELEQLNNSLELINSYLKKKRAALARERGSEKK